MEEVTATPEATPAAPAAPVKEKNKSGFPKILLVILVLVVLAALLGGMYFLGKNSLSMQKPAATPTAVKTEASPSPTPALTYNTYVNAKYSYSIDFPSTWYNREFTDTKTGSAFTKSSKPKDYASESITIDANRRITNAANQTFEDYAKNAATNEIQNYKKLSTIKQITTTSGIIGYKTTWMVQSIGPGGTTESLPITYFEIPGNNNYVIKVSLDKEEDLVAYDKMILSFRFNQQVKAADTFLEITDYGVKFKLSEDIKDAYVVKKDGYIYLKVHSLDTETPCKTDDTSTAALGKVGKDEINPMSETKYSDSYQGVTIGNYFYYTELAQYECAQSTAGKALLVKVRTAFKNASTTIEAL